MEKTWTWSLTAGQFWGRDHEEIIDICRQAGIVGLEGGGWLFDRCPEGELDSIARQYREAGIRIETYHLPFGGPYDIAAFYETQRHDAVDSVKRGIERAVRMGATVGILHPTATSFDVCIEGLGPYLRQFGKSLETLLPFANSMGFTLALENMLPGQGEAFGSMPAHFDRIVSEFDHPRLAFCLDTGHALCALGPQRAHEMFDQMAPRMAAFHLADNAGDRDSHLAPGRGLVDWGAVFRGMARLGFDRCACIETPPFAPGPHYSAEAYRDLVTELDSLVDAAFSSAESD